MKFKKTRIAFSVVGILCGILSLSMWIRSYQWLDIVRLGSAQNLASLHGRIRWDKSLGLDVSGPDMPATRFGLILSQFGVHSFPLQISHYFGDSILIVPYWLITCFCLAAIFSPWFPVRYSLRTLLIATTAVAVALWFITWMARW